MVKNRLAEPDAQEHGWLLDGYPRSAEQAEAIEAVNIRPDVFVLINVRQPAANPLDYKEVRFRCNLYPIPYNHRRKYVYFITVIMHDSLAKLQGSILIYGINGSHFGIHSL